MFFSVHGLCWQEDNQRQFRWRSYKTQLGKKKMLWTSVIDRFQQQRFWAVQWGWTSKTEHGMLHDLEGFPLTIIEHMDFQGDIWIPIQLSELSQTLGNYRKPHNNILAHILAIEDVWSFHGFIDRPSMILQLASSRMLVPQSGVHPHTMAWHERWKPFVTNRSMQCWCLRCRHGVNSKRWACCMPL